MTIRNRRELQEHLIWTMRIEAFNIPPYLYAMYSLEDQQSDAAALIRSVATEEMLHLALAANLLLAVGGSPTFYDRTLVPAYPAAAPHHQPELVVSLERCSPEVVRSTFMAIEQPTEIAEDPGDMEHGEYNSQGQFYFEVETAIERMAGEGDLFSDPQRERQLGDPSFYGVVRFDEEDSGGLLAITDFDTARTAIETAIYQGEGLRDHHWADPSHRELTHYYKFAALADGTTPLGSVLPVATNPKLREMSESVRPIAELFNAACSYVLVTIDDLYAPIGDDARGPLIDRQYSLMSSVMAPIAAHLVRQPIGDGSGRNAGPTFDFYEFGSDAPLAGLDHLASRVAAAQPDLGDVADTIAGLS